MISIVIPAYNEADHIGRTLASISAQQFNHPFEVIVVDNNSTDGTAEVTLESKGNLNLRVIKEIQRGRGAARAAGFVAAQGEIICSTDADSVVPPNWLAAMTAPLLKDDTYVATAGTCRIDDCPPFTNWFFNWFQPALMYVYRFFLGHVFLSGFSFAIRKNAYQTAGGFATNLNALEDNDLGFRVHKIGPIKFVPNCPVLASGRRFKPSLWHGLFSYVAPFVNLFILGRKEAYLRDVRK